MGTLVKQRMMRLPVKMLLLLVLPPGTLMLKSNVLELHGMIGYTRTWETLTLRERRLLSSDVVTKNPTLITTVIPLVNFTTSSLRLAALSSERLPLMDTTTLHQRLRLMENSLVLCATKTISTTCPRTVLRLGSPNSRSRASSKGKKAKVINN